MPVWIVPGVFIIVVFFQPFFFATCCGTCEKSIRFGDGFSDIGGKSFNYHIAITTIEVRDDISIHIVDCSPSVWRRGKAAELVI